MHVKRQPKRSETQANGRKLCSQLNKTTSRCVITIKGTQRRKKVIRSIIWNPFCFAHITTKRKQGVTYRCNLITLLRESSKSHNVEKVERNML